MVVPGTTITGGSLKLTSADVVEQSVVEEEGSSAQVFIGAVAAAGIVVVFTLTRCSV